MLDPRAISLAQLPPEETIRLAMRADPRAILLRKVLVIGALIVLSGALAMAARRVPLAQLPLAILILAVLTLIWSALEWWCEAYVLTEHRIIWVFGVLRRARIEIRLDQVRHIVETRAIRERLFGLSTIGAASAGTGTLELVWSMTNHRDRLADEIRKATDGTGSFDSGSASSDGEARASTNRPLVLGVVGGIGAGKSAVSDALARRGFVVVDSDRAAHEVLERDDVRRTLVGWWGERVLTPEGRIDRGVVASIVFADSEQRRRLEGLVHPIVKTARADVVAAATESGAPGVVVDAPLLFEAGVDQECDAVLFVDAPHAQRLERVRSRGWDASELDRREASQLSLDEKRSRSDATVRNDGTLAELDERVAAALVTLRAGG